MKNLVHVLFFIWKQDMFLHFMLHRCLSPWSPSHRVQRDKNIHIGLSTVWVSLCLRNSIYSFPRYNIRFRQRLSGCQGQGRDVYQDPSQDHLSNSDEDGGLARWRDSLRTSSKIASAKIAKRSIPGKVRSNKSTEMFTVILFFHPLVTLCCC